MSNCAMLDVGTTYGATRREAVDRAVTLAGDYCAKHAGNIWQFLVFRHGDDWACSVREFGGQAVAEAGRQLLEAEA